VRTVVGAGAQGQGIAGRVVVCGEYDENDERSERNAGKSRHRHLKGLTVAVPTPRFARPWRAIHHWERL
jgi:hypothetical protein